MTADEATIDVIKNQLPKVANLVADGILNVENVDVFCEKGVFNVDQTRQILKEARKFGFKINFHGEELCQLNSVEVSKTNLGSQVGRSSFMIYPFHFMHFKKGRHVTWKII